MSVRLFFISSRIDILCQSCILFWVTQHFVKIYFSWVENKRVAARLRKYWKTAHFLKEVAEIQESKMQELWDLGRCLWWLFLMIPKLHFVAYVANSVEPFLKKYRPEKFDSVFIFWFKGKGYNIVWNNH